MESARAVQQDEPTILVIDDDKVLTSLLDGILNSVGTVLIANTGPDGLGLARDEQPDLILLDVQMPGQDGFDIISELKTDPTVRHIPVIFITGEVIPEIESHCLEAGGADYIAKPVNPRVLKARARTHLLIKQQADMLAELSFRDALTGTLNQGAFDERLESECARAAWRDRPVALLLIDVDEFAAYNRMYGHVAGDDVLVALADVLTAQAKQPGSVVARVGGDSFAVLLPEASTAEASTVAERVCSAVRDLGMRHHGSSASDQVTVSVGVAGMPAVDAVRSAEGLLAAAGLQMRRAKLSGRNQVCSSAG